MRASELLGAEVLDASGEAIGEVVDLRLVQDGQLLASGLAALRVHTLVVSKGSWASRLGYDRADVNRPALLNAWLGRRAKHVHLVPWEQIVGFEPGSDLRHGRIGTVRTRVTA